MLEVQESDLAQVLKRYRVAGLHCMELGPTGDAGPHALVRKGGWCTVGRLGLPCASPRGGGVPGQDPRALDPE